MSDRPYMVRYTPYPNNAGVPTEERYGHVDKEQDGKYVVSDVIYPVSFLIEKDQVTPHEDFDAVWKHQEEECNKATARAMENDKDTLCVNDIFNVGVADGSAWYIVKKVNKKTCKVELRGFCPDSYQCQILGIGGTFPIDTIRNQALRFKSWQQMMVQA
jgi:hypothetical protein